MADTTRKPPEGRLIPAAWAPWAPYHQGHRGTRDAASEPRFPSYDVADLVSSIINICRATRLQIVMEELTADHEEADEDLQLATGL